MKCEYVTYLQCIVSMTQYCAFDRFYTKNYAIKLFCYRCRPYEMLFPIKWPIYSAQRLGYKQKMTLINNNIIFTISQRASALTQASYC